MPAAPRIDTAPAEPLPLKGAARRALFAGAALSGAAGRAWLGARLRGREAGGPVAIAVRETFERLGPAYVKLGQLISVRPDVFPPDLTFELSKLQDAVAPAPYETIASVVQAEFGRAPESLWGDFEREPLAAGSVAQVHCARDADGRELVVKVQRPEAKALLELDVGIAARLARWATALGIVRGIDAVALVEEFAASVRRELDFRVEAAHADRFAFLFAGDPHIRIPRVEWSRTSRRVFTMERIEGWTLSQIEAARAAGVDSGLLAREGSRAFMQQVLVFGFFHADLHPANLMLTRDGRIAYLDFGIVGSLSERERRLVARLLGALTARDPEQAIAVSDHLGVSVPAGERAAAVAELGVLLDRFLREDRRVEFAQFGRQFLALLRRHHVRIPPGYGMLVKALVTVEGVSQTLAPDINLVAAAQPFAAALALNEMLGPTLAGRLAWRLVSRMSGDGPAGAECCGSR